MPRDEPATAASWIESCPAAARDHEVPALGRASVIALLNELLEGERAGAKAAILCRDDTLNPSVDAVLHALGCDEGHFCSVLVRHLQRLGTTPSRATGSFYERLRAIAGLPARLAFLNRGQRWVIRRLDEALPGLRDGWLRSDLHEMREVHVRNVARCEALITQLAKEPTP
jgi:hypothetical protein